MPKKEIKPLHLLRIKEVEEVDTRRKKLVFKEFFHNEEEKRVTRMTPLRYWLG